jgi:putative addiction module component (TIGR02574 family)
MAMTVDQLVEAAMRLPAASRAQLAEQLLESLEVEEVERIERLWVEEAKRRRDEIRSGRATVIPGEAALRQARDLLQP